MTCCKSARRKKYEKNNVNYTYFINAEDFYKINSITIKYNNFNQKS